MNDRLFKIFTLMLALARDPGLRARMGRAARAKMEREYDARVQNARLEALFDSLF